MYTHKHTVYIHTIIICMHLLFTCFIHALVLFIETIRNYLFSFIVNNLLETLIVKSATVRGHVTVNAHNSLSNLYVHIISAEDHEHLYRRVNILDTYRVSDWIYCR